MNLFEKIGLVERDAVDLPIAQSAASELVLDEVDVDAEITSPQTSFSKSMHRTRWQTREILSSQYRH